MNVIKTKVGIYSVPDNPREPDITAIWISQSERKEWNWVYPCSQHEVRVQRTG